MHRLLLSLAISMLSAVRSQDQRRPIYSIAHMVNSIKEVRRFLEKGANVLESDVQFYRNGSIRRVHHGFPCDLGRWCNYQVKLPMYLDYVKKVADPVTVNNYNHQLIMQFLDLKLRNVGGSEAKDRAGAEIADAVLDYLWPRNGESNTLKVLLYAERITDFPVFSGFINRFKTRGKQELLINVGFDGGTGNVQSVKRSLEDVGVDKRIWMGDGITNFISAFYTVVRLGQELTIRNSNSSYIDKVYHWTIDSRLRMGRSLKLGVDGFITNRPEILNQILTGEPYASEMRLATPSDDPFVKFETKKN